MKVFTIPLGTRGMVIQEQEGWPTIRPWRVRQELNYGREHLVADPVTAETRSAGHPYDLLAQRGLAMFRDPTSPQYVLAVPFEAVVVS